jgi:hypothetical protein
MKSGTLIAYFNSDKDLFAHARFVCEMDRAARNRFVKFLRSHNC